MRACTQATGPGRALALAACLALAAPAAGRCRRCCCRGCGRFARAPPAAPALAVALVLVREVDHVWGVGWGGSQKAVWMRCSLGGGLARRGAASTAAPALRQTSTRQHPAAHPSLAGCCRWGRLPPPPGGRCRPPPRRRCPARACPVGRVGWGEPGAAARCVDPTWHRKSRRRPPRSADAGPVSDPCTWWLLPARCSRNM